MQEIVVVLAIFTTIYAVYLIIAEVISRMHTSVPGELIDYVIPSRWVDVLVYIGLGAVLWGYQDWYVQGIIAELTELDGVILHLLFPTVMGTGLLFFAVITLLMCETAVEKGKELPVVWKNWRLSRTGRK